jgi:general secretion pathway protein A
MDELGYWGLEERPFEEVCNTRFFFASDDHREALDRLIYIVNDQNMNMGLLTGEVGSGKTLTKNVLRSSLPRHDFAVIDFENSNFRFTDLLFDVIKRLSFRDARIALDEEPLPDRNDKYLLMQTLKERLSTLIYEEHRHLVLIFDEAQQIEDGVLDEIKNLTNLASETQSYVTIFLVGQPELREKISRLKQVDQRIFLRFHLNNLDFKNTVNYIQHRLQVGGYSGSGIFTREAQELLFRATGGVPREINRLCKLALTDGFAHELPEIAETDIAAILEDLKAHRT